jgi:hypothetical protein
VAERVMSMKVASANPESMQRQTEEEEETIQPKSLLQGSANGTDAGGKLENKLSSSKGGGSPLPDEVRSFMEPRFGADFSTVRVHTDSSAVQMNKELGAQAFTHGSDIYYGSGKSPSKDTLTAHELTHTIQQTGAVRAKLQTPSEAQQNGEADEEKQAQFSQPQLDVSVETASSREKPSQVVESNSDTKAEGETNSATQAVQAVDPQQQVQFSQAVTAQAEGKQTQDGKQAKGKDGADTTTVETTTDTANQGGTSPVESPGGSPVAGASPINAGGGVDGSSSVAGQESASVPPQATPLSAEDPGQIIEQLKNTPPTQLAATYAQAGTASAQAWENQKQQLQESIPEIPAPTGLSAQDAEPTQVGQKAADKAAQSKGEPNVEVSKGQQSGESKAKYDPQVPEAPPAPAPTPTQLAGGEVQESGESDSQLSQSAQNELAGIKLDTSQISTNAGPPPKVDLSGEADPAQMQATQTQSQQEVQAAKLKAAADIQQDFGENRIFPKVSKETLKANKELTAVAPPAVAGVESPALPGEAVGGLNQSLSPFLREKIAPEQQKYQAGKTKFDADVVQARADADQEISTLDAETKNKQIQEQQQAKLEVTQAKQEWQTELDGVEKEYQDKAGQATKEQQQKIDTEKVKGDEKAAKHLEDAQKDAQKEAQKADREANQKKQDAEKESGGFWGWAKSAASALIDGLKQAVNFIYDNLRKAVKAIFEAAKKLAMAAIDLARQAIVGLIRGFGAILKGLVKIVFAAFPNIAKKITAKIDQAVNKAVKAVNMAADFLKKGVAAVLDFLASALDAILAAYQAIYNAALDAIGAVVETVIGAMEKIGNLVTAAQQMPDHFWGQMSEEVLGMDVTQPLPFERTAEDCVQCNAPATTAGTPLAAEGANSELAAMLSKDDFTEDDIAVDRVTPFDVDPEFLASLNLQDGGEVEFGESNDPANSMEAIKAELAGEANPEASVATETASAETVTGGEVAPTGACCDDEATAQAKLEQMMSQKVEGAESTQKQGEPAKQGDIPANMRTLGPLTPGQRASYMFNQLKQGIKQWFAANWGKLLAGAIAGITGFIAANILTGGAVMAAVPPLLQIIGAVMAGVALAQIGGYVADYATQGWAGEIAGAAKSLARAVAVGAIELVFALLFNAGAIFKALKGGVKGAVRAAATSVKTAVKATAKSAKELAKIGAKGAKTAFKNGKIMLKSVKSGFAKGAKSLDELAERLKGKLRFKKFSITRYGKKIQLWGHINPKILLADGTVIDETVDSGYQSATFGDAVTTTSGKKGILLSDNAIENTAHLPKPNINFRRNLKDIKKLRKKERWKAGEEFVEDLYQAQRQEHFRLADLGTGFEETGGRYVDVVPSRSGQTHLKIEVKSYQGYLGKGKINEVPLSSNIQDQILKDVYLMEADPQNFSPKWIFTDAKPSEELAKTLDDFGIPYTVYDLSNLK